MTDEGEAEGLRFLRFVAAVWIYGSSRPNRIPGVGTAAQSNPDILQYLLVFCGGFFSEILIAC